MPLKTHRHQQQKHKRKHPKHYAKVYWPYLPLVILLAIGLSLGQPFVARSQRDVLSYATNVHADGLLEATNTQRQNASRSRLRLNKQLTQAAQAKANDMMQRDYWSHNTPDGKEPWTFIAAAGYKYQKAGENLAYGFASSAETVSGWMNSPSHKANLLDKAYNEVGFGIANATNYQNNGAETIVVAMYGQPIQQQAATGTSIPLSTVPTDTPVTTATSPTQEPSVRSISKAQALTGGKAPRMPFGLGLLSGAALLYLLLHHGLALRRALRQGEKFVLHHPLLDVTIITLVAVCTLLSQSVGVIR